MSRHLDDREIASAVAGLDLAPASEEHVRSCLDCRRQVAEMERLIAHRRIQMTGAEPDWEAAHAAVMERLELTSADGGNSRTASWWRPLAAAAAVLMAVAAVVLAPSGVDRAPAGSELAVDEILAEVDAVLEDDSIPGFEAIDPGVDTLEGYVANGSS